MSKTKKIIAILTENRIQLLITLTSVLIAIANFFVASKLTPLAKDIEFLAKRVGAIENNYVDDKEISNINSRLDKIENRLDYLINLHVK